ncbi:sugar porter family MFS transporter [Pseudanabaena sp. BC1403]|uniref:sugar porter family MFS transporter n=1 Tax=Pseudanabaena sp. BC1403 TaxID=2043171 RepID=UPI000CD95A1F|nr:sugar porter family MFS transporter [Pseudanabaena sp. BC1403]
MINTRQKNFRIIYIAAVISALGGLLFGYDIGAISSSILFISEQFALSPLWQGVLVSSVSLGAIVGAVAGGILSDRLGRRYTLSLFSIIFSIGGICSAMAPMLFLLVVGRVLVGIGLGAISFVTPLYISEIAPVDKRGSLVFLNQLALSTGLVISYPISYALSSTVEPWRWILAFSVVPASILIVGILGMPESPRWLINHNHMNRARKVLIQISGATNVDQEISEIQTVLQQRSGNWSELLQPSIRPALFIGVSLAMLQQFTGINTIVYFTPTILQLSGFKSSSIAILATIGIGMINFLSTVLAIWLVDRVGRRPLLLCGILGMVVSLSILGLVFYFSQSPDVSMGWLTIASLMIYVSSFVIGLASVFWLLIAEIYPSKLRAKAMSIATVANWSASLITSISFLTLIQWFGKAGTFWLYGLIGMSTWLLVFFLVPETKGLTLEEIEIRLGKDG